MQGELAGSHHHFDRDARPSSHLHQELAEPGGGFSLFGLRVPRTGRRPVGEERCLGSRELDNLVSIGISLAGKPAEHHVAGPLGEAHGSLTVLLVRQGQMSESVWVISAWPTPRPAVEPGEGVDPVDHPLAACSTRHSSSITTK